MRYLHFDLDTDEEARRELLALLVSLGVKPTETQHTLSIPSRLKSELETYLPGALQLLDEMDADPCCIELRHVIVQMGADESLALRNRANAGLGRRLRFRIRVGYSVIIPATGNFVWRRTAKANGAIASVCRRDRRHSMFSGSG